MKPKTIKIIYWIITILFSSFMIFSGVSEVIQTEQSKQIMKQLGYPIYVNTIIGVAKILGALAILQWKFRTLKEWAYAGFTIDFIGAGASLYFAGEGILIALSTTIFLAVMFVSYFLWKKIEKRTLKK